MKYRRRLAATALSLSMAFSAVYPAVPAFAAAWERNANGSYLASDGSIITGITSRGIDVSHWKQSIDWNAVAADDVQFVMLGTRYNNDVDPYFRSTPPVLIMPDSGSALIFILMPQQQRWRRQRQILS